MDAIKKRLLQVSGVLDDYDSANDAPSSVIWSHRLCGKKIVTNDFARAEKSRIAASRTGMAGIRRPPRIFYHKASDISLGIEFADYQSSHLLNLPIEIRLQILIGALKPCRSYSMQENKTAASLDAALIFTCKQLYIEARAIAFHINAVKESELPSYVSLRNRGSGVSNMSMDVKRGLILSFDDDSRIREALFRALFQNISFEMAAPKTYTNIGLRRLKVKISTNDDCKV